jgi:hypothetical protein
MSKGSNLILLDINQLTVNKYVTFLILKKLKRLEKYGQYTLFKGYDASDDGLNLFADDFDI